MTLKEMLDVNLRGIALEKAGHVDAAIEVYESGLAGGTDTPHTYRRLIVIYRRLKRFDDLERVQAASIERFGKSL